MQKTKAVMDNAMAQIRPLLTPEQQKTLDDTQNDRRGNAVGTGAARTRDQDDSTTVRSVLPPGALTPAAAL
jgi:hypothetical protein